jgi:hypothetical protein
LVKNLRGSSPLSDIKNCNLFEQNITKNLLNEFLGKNFFELKDDSINFF